MRKFQSGKRYLRERIFEDENRKEAVDMAKPLFINNSRYIRCENSDRRIAVWEFR